MFRPLSLRSVRWRPVEGDGLEHLTIEARDDGGALVRSVVVGSSGSHAFGASYEIACDPDFRVTSFRIETTHARRLAMTSPVPGRWLDEAGATRAELDGCVDLDFSATPFSNTLPIRRLRLRKADGQRALRMVYVRFDTLAPFAHPQFYTAIEEGRLYRFANHDHSFVADLPLDEDGLVLDYPGLFKRL